MTQNEFALFQQRQADLKQFIGVLTGVLNAPESTADNKLAANEKIKELIPAISLKPEEPSVIKKLL